MKLATAATGDASRGMHTVGEGDSKRWGGGERGPRSVGMCSTFVVNFT